MTLEKLLKALDFYEAFLKREKTSAEELVPSTVVPENMRTALAHCAWMIPRIRTFAKDDLEKAFRWLGFIQGVLWSRNLFSIDDLRAHNILE